MTRRRPLGDAVLDAEAPVTSAAPPGSLRHDAIRGVMWTSAERWLVRLAGLGTFVVLGRLLEPLDFGLVGLATACLTVLTVVSELGFSTWLLQAPHVGDRETGTAFWTSAASGSVLAAVLFAVAGPLAALFDVRDLAPVLRAFSALLVLSGLASVPTALLMRRMQFRALAVRKVTSILAGSVAGITLAVAGAGVWALVGQAIVQQTVSLAAIMISARWLPRLRWSFATARDMTAFGSRAVGIHVLTQVKDQGEGLLIGAILGVTALGYWSVAARLYSVLLDIGLSVITTVATPTFVRLRHDRERLERAYTTSLASSAVVVGPALVALAVLSPQMIPLMFGERWLPSAPVAVALAVGGLAAAGTYFDRAVFLACGRLGIELLLVIIVVSLHVALIPLVGPSGLLPLAIVLAARNYVTWPMRVVALNRACGIRPRAQRSAVRVLVACAAAGLLTVAIATFLPSGSTWSALLARAGLLAVLLAGALALTARGVIGDLVRDVRDVRRGRDDGPPPAGHHHPDVSPDLVTAHPPAPGRQGAAS